MFSHRGVVGAQLFQAHLIMDRKWSMPKIHGWMDRKLEQQSSASIYTEISRKCGGKNNSLKP